MTERFTLLSELGRGGMGVVWKARDEETGQIVALKLLREVYAEDADYVTRFERELELAKRIHSRNVVSVIGFGVRDHTPYLALEYVDGPSLRELLTSHGPYDWPEGKALIAQIAQGLADAHAAGVIHRDLKPSNVLIGSDGVAKLADFGIAKGLDLTRVTGTSTLLGTPAYLAPEGPVDERSDLYSLGVIAYEILTGVVPFEGRTYQEVILRHVREAPNLAKLSEEARPIVGWLLAKDAAERPQRAGDLLPVLFGARPVPELTATASAAAAASLPAAVATSTPLEPAGTPAAGPYSTPPPGPGPMHAPTPPPGPGSAPWAAGVAYPATAAGQAGYGPMTAPQGDRRRGGGVRWLAAGGLVVLVAAIVVSGAVAMSMTGSTAGPGRVDPSGTPSGTPAASLAVAHTPPAATSTPVASPSASASSVPSVAVTPTPLPVAPTSQPVITQAPPPPPVDTPSPEPPLVTAPPSGPPSTPINAYTSSAGPGTYQVSITWDDDAGDFTGFVVNVGGSTTAVGSDARSFTVYSDPNYWVCMSVSAVNAWGQSAEASGGCALAS